MTNETTGTPPGVGIRSMRKVEALYRLAECHAVAWIVVVMCALTPAWVKACAAIALGFVVGFAAAQGASRMGSIERQMRRIGNLHAKLSDLHHKEFSRGFEEILNPPGVRELEAVLAMPSWSPQAREGIRACISQLKHGDHTAHLAEARAKLGIAERDVKHSKASKASSNASSKSKGGAS